MQIYHNRVQVYHDRVQVYHDLCRQVYHDRVQVYHEWNPDFLFPDQLPRVKKQEQL